LADKVQLPQLDRTVLTDRPRAAKVRADDAKTRLFTGTCRAAGDPTPNRATVAPYLAWCSGSIRMTTPETGAVTGKT